MKKLILILLCIAFIGCSKSSTSFEGEYKMDDETVIITKGENAYFIELPDQTMLKAELKDDMLHIKSPMGPATIEHIDENTLYFQIELGTAVKLIRIEE